MILDNQFLAAGDYYEIIGLNPEANQVEIEAAFKDSSVGLDLRHPDPQERIQAAEKMLTLSEAYEALSDPVTRSRYDLQVLGRKNLPVQEKVEILFKEGLRAFRSRQTDLALRYLKEVSNLYPHRALYRVHLAIAYADKEWLNFTRSELETALRLDPDYMFAKETIAKLLFKLPDRRLHWYHNKLNQQVIALASVLVLLGVLMASGLPQKYIKGAYQKIAGGTVETDASLQAQLPEDMRQELSQKQGIAISQKKITFFKADYRPSGKVYDYTKLEAQTKTFYSDQQMVVVTYSDGSILTYRPAELKGWKKVAELPVMITQTNELIPSPDQLTLLLPNKEPVDLLDPATAWMFPEYGLVPSLASQAPVSTPVQKAVQSRPSEETQEPKSTQPDTTQPDTAQPQPVKASTPAAKTHNPYGGNP